MVAVKNKKEGNVKKIFGPLLAILVLAVVVKSNPVAPLPIICNSGKRKSDHLPGCVRSVFPDQELGCLPQRVSRGYGASVDEGKQSTDPFCG